MEGVDLGLHSLSLFVGLLDFQRTNTRHARCHKTVAVQPLFTSGRFCWLQPFFHLHVTTKQSFQTSRWMRPLRLSSGLTTHLSICAWAKATRIAFGQEGGPALWKPLELLIRTHISDDERRPARDHNIIRKKVRAVWRDLQAAESSIMFCTYV